MATESTLRACLSHFWRLRDVRLSALAGGMNSRTWLVERDGVRWVAKLVPASMADSFAAGLRAAEMLQHAGIPAGAPARTRDGGLVAILDGCPLALLAWVGGEPLTRDTESEQRLVGRALGRVHRVLTGMDIDGATRFGWVKSSAPHLGLRRWLQPAVREAVEAYERLPARSLTWGMLHGDPAPEAFLRGGAGTCGVIDWGSAVRGPLVYDVASAVMYVGGWRQRGALVDGYLEHAPISRGEIDRSLLTMLRYRWAAQADYFARRIAAGDMTGIEDASENEAGLDDARAALADGAL